MSILTVEEARQEILRRFWDDVRHGRDPYPLFDRDEATPATLDAAKQVIADGVEFDATRKVLADWFEKHNLVFVQDSFARGDWLAQQADGLRFEPHRWLSFHEMLAALLERVDAQNRGTDERQD